MAIHKFVKAILNDEVITIFGDGTQTRDFTFAGDVVEATMLAANNDVVGEVFNMGGGSRISVNELIKRLEEITGREAGLKYIEKQKGDVTDTLANVNKTKALLNWNPRVDINRGLKSFVEWFTSEVEKME